MRDGAIHAGLYTLLLLPRLSNQTMRTMSISCQGNNEYRDITKKNRTVPSVMPHRSNLDRIIYPITGYTGGIIDPINDWLTEGGWRIILGDDQGGLL